MAGIPGRNWRRTGAILLTLAVTLSAFVAYSNPTLADLQTTTSTPASPGTGVGVDAPQTLGPTITVTSTEVVTSTAVSTTTATLSTTVTSPVLLTTTSTSYATATTTATSVSTYTSVSTQTVTSTVTSTSTSVSTYVPGTVTTCSPNGQLCKAFASNATISLNYKAPSLPNCFTIQLNGNQVGTTWTQFVVVVSNGTVTEGWEYWDFSGGQLNCPGSTSYGTMTYCWVDSGGPKPFSKNMTLSPADRSPPVPAPKSYILNVVGCEPGQPVSFANGTDITATITPANWIAPNSLYPATAESSNLRAIIVGETVTFVA